jgi:cation transport ATPase
VITPWDSGFKYPHISSRVEALVRATELARGAGDIVLLHNDLKGLKTIYTISKRVVRAAKENLSWTFIYNTTLIPIAGGSIPIIAINVEA